jgi:cytoskeletal protein CcmA (bactofilin family)
LKQNHSRSRTFSGFLDTGTSFAGDFAFEGTVRIDGHVTGRVTTPDVLIVGESATVRADIRAGSVQIHGKVIGDVSCSGRVEICPGGHLEGNLETPRLVIEDGGSFEGRSHTTRPASGKEDANGAQRVPRSASHTHSEPATTPAPSPSSGEDAAGKPARTGLRWKILGRALESTSEPVPSEHDHTPS